MPFGLCNAPATFERLMDRVLQGLRWSRCLVYLDDIISFGSTFDDALTSLTLIFERLRSYGLQLKSTKCHLFRSSVPFLGHIVGRRGLECDPAKIEAQRMLTWSPYIQVKTRWLTLTMICLNRLLLLVIAGKMTTSGTSLAMASS